MQYFGQNDVVKSCLDMTKCNTNVADGPYGCTISFLNPNFEYPQSFDECLKLTKYETSELNSVMHYKDSCGVRVDNLCTIKNPATDAIVAACPNSYKKEDHQTYTICEKSFKK